MQKMQNIEKYCMAHRILYHKSMATKLCIQNWNNLVDIYPFRWNNFGDRTAYNKLSGNKSGSCKPGRVFTIRIVS